MSVTYQCVERDCKHPAMERQGNRGPKPRRCQKHTQARKRAIHNHPVNTRSSRPDCCQSGVCPQHQQARESERESKAREYLDRREAAWLPELLGSIQGHIEHSMTVSDTGPYEGRTVPHVFHADPFKDDPARSWFAEHGRWAEQEKFGLLVEG